MQHVTLSVLTADLYSSPQTSSPSPSPECRVRVPSHVGRGGVRVMWVEGESESRVMKVESESESRVT